MREWINKDETSGGKNFPPLHMAAYFGNMKLIRFLIENGADIHEVNTSH